VLQRKKNGRSKVHGEEEKKKTFLELWNGYGIRKAKESMRQQKKENNREKKT